MFIPFSKNIWEATRILESESATGHLWIIEPERVRIRE